VQRGANLYQIESSGQAIRALRLKAFVQKQFSSTVLLLGLTSFFTDISSEMVASILPLYLVVNLQATPLIFGLIDGLYLGAASIVRLIGGFSADRWQRHKEIAFLGYLLSAFSRLLMVFVGGAWLAFAGIVLLERIGKGIRTAPRDALISLTSSPATLATSFGLHRTFDAAGSLVGPLLAFGILAAASEAYDAVFVVSVCAAGIGLAVLGFFVTNPQRLDSTLAQPTAAPGASVIELLRVPDYRPILLIAAVFSLSTISDGFIYLTLQRRLSFDVGFFPLLFVATALIYTLLALPVGRLADILGRRNVFLGGYSLLLVVYLLLLVPGLGTPGLLASLAVLGAYYAATDGVLSALTASKLPGNLQGTGLALLTTVTSLGRLFASILFGFAWTLWGGDVALVVFVVSLATAIIVTGIVTSLEPRIQRTSP
jgi:MFS family permease